MDLDSQQEIPGSPDKQLAGLAPGLAQALAMGSAGMLIARASAPDFPILYANPAHCRMSGLAAARWSGRSAALLAGAQHQAVVAAALHSASEGGVVERLPLHGVGADGAPCHAELSISAARDAAGAVVQLVCLIEDISAHHLQKAQLAYLTTHDDLTGLPNRSLFNQRLQLAVTHAQNCNSGVAVLCLALDGYSLINETLGHLASDALLVAVGLRLQGCLGPRDALARHGGSEFVLIMGEVGGAAQAARLCEQFIADMAAPFAVAGQTLYAGASIGVARYPDDAEDGVTLLRYADMALSHARALGVRHQLFEADMSRRTSERAQMEAALRVALADGQLRLYYQPVADLQRGMVCELEALVRWQHPALGLIDASQFIALAESAGLTIAIGHWSMGRAAADLAEWRGAGLPPVRVALNISPKQLRDPGLGASVARMIDQAGVSPAQLVFEMTEDALMQDAQLSARALAELKALGVGLTLDDFGIGYSSLNHLKRFPLDLVKIDSSLIENVDKGSEEATMVTTIISMAHHLGLEVLAEGVETEAQCDFLRRNMCDQIQGNFFQPPCDMRATADLLTARLAVPPHLLRIQKHKRTLLLVDDEANIVSALKRLLRRDEYTILTANSGQEGLNVLAANAVDVIVSDQRMPGMIGADFLRAAKGLYPETIRIMLSGYTELQSVTDAVNEGAIYKFLTKPWDDEQLRGHIAEAFRLKEIADDNERLNLELRTANHELASANRRMEDLLRQKQQQITRDEISLNVARELLQFVPLAVVGLDDDGMVAFVNGAAESVFRQSGAILGNEAAIVLPELFPNGEAFSGTLDTDIGGRRYRIVSHSMGAKSQSRGSLITISPYEG